MKKNALPHSVLVLFSNSFAKQIDTLFYGSLIFEIDLQESLENFPEVQSMLEILNCFGEVFSKATVVTNPRASAITMAKLTGIFPRIINISGASGHEAFRHYQIYVEKYFQMTEHLLLMLADANHMETFNKFDSSDMLKNYRPCDELDRISKQHERMAQSLKNVMNKDFV